MPNAPDRAFIFNVKYSSNLGDGVLSACLESSLKNQHGISTTTIDLAGREQLAGNSAKRAILLSTLERMPGWLRRSATSIGLRAAVRLKLDAHYRRHLAQGSVVIGGGNLFSDHDLNFPTKVRHALLLSARRKLPVAIFGAGVAPEMTERGRALFLDGLYQARLRHVWLRDKASVAAWQRHFGEIPVQPRLCRDPALLVNDRFPPADRSAAVKIGVGVTSPAALRYHSRREMNDRALADWYAALVNALCRSGHPVVVFDNGSPEDRAFVRQHRRGLEGAAQAAGAALRFAEPADPAELCALIAGLRCCVAHRLHANIIAFAYGVPSIGLRWDSKLDAFLASIDRSRWLADAPGDDPVTVAGRLEEAMAAGIDPALHHRTLAAARADIDALAAWLTGSESPA